MKIYTERLEVIPLDDNQLKLITTNINLFEQNMGSEYCGEPLKGMLLSLFKKQIELVRDNPFDYLWHTFWIFKLSGEAKLIGSFCFKNAPDNNGQVEIGYGIGTKFSNHGYTSEVVEAMCKWALSQPNVFKIVAETEKSNYASERVLSKCNFVKYQETECCYWWKLN